MTRPLLGIALALAGAVGGCGAREPCDGVDGTCLSLHLAGDVGRVDAVELRLAGAARAEHRAALPSGVESMPVALAVRLGDARGTATVSAIALAGARTVAAGRRDVALAPGAHPTLTVTLAAIERPSCTDGYRDGDESDVDCGGPACPACADGLRCRAPHDCASGTCSPAGACAPGGCADGKRDGDETDVDCGGPACPACGDGRACTLARDCASGACVAGACARPSCGDGVRDGDETDVDCGGPACPACGDGRACKVAKDCASGVCGEGARCAAPTCTDGVKNGGESDVDCGGPTCPACNDGRACTVARDCASRVCGQGSRCVAASCTDGVKNGGETDVDCGGGCAPCADHLGCKLAKDCASGVCAGGGTCAPPSCTDGVKNGAETDVDCGGGCAPCANHLGCKLAKDCASGVCAVGGTCSAPTCSDGVKNGDESDVDCGGPSCKGCGLGRACGAGGDCASKTCVSARCGFRLAAPAPVAVGGPAAAVELADLDGDQRLDVAAAVGGAVVTLRGQGDGTLLAPKAFPGGGGAITALAIADLDGDGRLDVAALQPDDGHVALLYGTGGGALSAPTLLCAAPVPCSADDQCPFAKTCTKGFCGPDVCTFSTTGIVARAFAGTGKPDLAVSVRLFSEVALHRNMGGALQPAPGGEWPIVGTGPDRLVAADFDGDGRLDLATVNDVAHSVSVVRGAPNGQFLSAVSTPIGGGMGDGSLGLAAGDLDHDGHADLVVSSTVAGGKPGTTVWVLRGLAGGKLAAPVAYPVAAGPRQGALVDLDHDGFLDLAVPCTDAGAITLLRNAGDGTLQPAGGVSGLAAPVALAAGPLRTVARPDLVVATATGLAVLLDDTP